MEELQQLVARYAAAQKARAAAQDAQMEKLMDVVRADLAVWNPAVAGVEATPVMTEQVDDGKSDQMLTEKLQSPEVELQPELLYPLLIEQGLEKED